MAVRLVVCRSAQMKGSDSTVCCAVPAVYWVCSLQCLDSVCCRTVYLGTNDFQLEACFGLAYRELADFRTDSGKVDFQMACFESDDFQRVGYQKVSLKSDDFQKVCCQTVCFRKVCFRTAGLV